MDTLAGYTDLDTLDGYTDEEVGRLVKEAARGHEQEAVAAMKTRYSFAEFLKDVGLTLLADLIREAASAVWEGIKGFFRSLFQ